MVLLIEATITHQNLYTNKYCLLRLWAGRRRKVEKIIKIISA